MLTSLEYDIVTCVSLVIDILSLYAYYEKSLGIKSYCPFFIYLFIFVSTVSISGNKYL